VDGQDAVVEEQAGDEQAGDGQAVHEQAAGGSVGDPAGASGGRRRIAIDSDVGEGFGAWSFGDDEAILASITAANVACGFHAGDPTILRGVTAAAARRGVSIGAQVSYRDLAGFGRRFVDVPRPQLVDDLLYQIGALQLFARLAGSRVSYVKAHGALYNTAARHAEHAAAIAEAIALTDPTLPMLCQPDTAAWRAALAAGVTPLAEVYADRAYTADGLLVPRARPGAVLTDPDEVADRAVGLVLQGRVLAITGETVTMPVPPAAICVHSDTPGAAAIAAALAAALRDAGIELVGVPAAPMGDGPGGGSGPEASP
jgi:UPF0271 protein